MKVAAPNAPGAKVPCSVVFPVEPACELSSTSVLFGPLITVDASTLNELKQVPPEIVPLPVAEKKPCASGPVCLRLAFNCDVPPPLEVNVPVHDTLVAFRILPLAEP